MPHKYVKHYSKSTDITYIACIPDHYKLLPENEPSEVIITEEEFNNTKKEYVIDIIMSEQPYKLYKC